ncbi:SNF2-related protein [Rubrobacter indicoceani]|uniref:SNF2-related protein n=1 Tax=Rubrobacter indicoceani TaxID=2051957 RepID=UPI000E5B0EB2|nr:SNF2-related protein [Rubrobacter indicoceani]
MTEDPLKPQHYRSRHLAHFLMLRAPANSPERLTQSISNARVDLNPHQVDAAMFAFRSPLSKGAILADEVGLGKTIEAGIVISQRWAERRRRILLIVPATLRRQWQAELDEKFFLKSRILETLTFNRLSRSGVRNPFDTRDEVVVCSYHFAVSKAEEVKRIGWDLIVMDEAHRLRNVYRTQNKMARAIRDATAHAPKLLLTATPLQNSLLELYGLANVVDPHVFGDFDSFRERFARETASPHAMRELKARLTKLCTRTLRKQVLEYIRFTRRVPVTQEFFPTDEEQRLYDNVTAYLQRETLVALPSSQRTLMTLVLRKLLASSTFAVAGTLRGLIRRLETLERKGETLPGGELLDDGFSNDFESLDDIEDEWAEPDPRKNGRPEINRVLLGEELALLREYADLAEGIQNNAKGEALLVALNEAFTKARELGAARKAVVFTESRRTQQYLLELLNADGYRGKVVLFNGTNTDKESREIYEKWSVRNGPSRSGSRSADLRAALIEEFRNNAEVLIATESAAEGVNLQFCSLVVNYDLPWNPQRVEQRIGRCHRYGQKHDVVVVNFLNRKNEADQRVFELLSEKFKLFSGVFGASDEVLGAVESGVDIERRIARVYQECRRSEDIQAAFDTLQRELEEDISGRLADTRKTLLDNFDEDVISRLKLHENETRANLTDHAAKLLDLMKLELPEADFHPDEPRFTHDGTDYHLDWREAERLSAVFLRRDHPLASSAIERAADRSLPVAALTLDYTNHPGIISALDPLQRSGTSGWLSVSKLTVESAETEEHLVLSGLTDSGEALDEELLGRMIPLIADKPGLEPLSITPPEVLTDLTTERVKSRLFGIEERRSAYFDEEVEKLDAWSDDLKDGLERELKELEKEIKAAKKISRAAASLQEKLTVQRQIKAAESKRNRKRRELYNAQDAIDVRRDELISGVESQLEQSESLETLFTVRWSLT